MLELTTIEALRRLRLHIEGSAIRGVLLLNDVLMALRALEGQRRYVLGETGMRYVAEQQGGQQPSEATTSGDQS